MSFTSRETREEEKVGRGREETERKKEKSSKEMNVRGKERAENEWEKNIGVNKKKKENNIINKDISIYI